MDEELEQLEESTYGNDILNFKVQLNCSWFKQIKQRQITSMFDHLIYTFYNFHLLPYSYTRKNDNFSFLELDPQAATRFIELLASLTLYHFSASSKETYYQCIDIRGLEFREIRTSRTRSKNYHTFLIGYDGMRVGYIFERKFAKYYICHTAFEISMEMFVRHWKITTIVKRYKILKMSLVEEMFDDYLTSLCDAVFHPGVEIVDAVVGSLEPGFGKITAAKLMQLLDYCKNVKQLNIEFGRQTLNTVPVETYAIILENDPSFLDIKEEIENWSTTAKRLEFFTFGYKGHIFQLHKNKLKRLVLLDGKWYWSDKCDIDGNSYKVYDSREYENDVYYKHDICLRLSHYNRVMAKLLSGTK